MKNKYKISLILTFFVATNIFAFNNERLLMGLLGLTKRVESVLGLENLTFSKSLMDSTTQAFGLVPRNIYNSYLFQKDGVLTFRDNKDNSDNYKLAHADFRDLTIDPKYNTAGYNKDSFSKNLKEIIDSLISINLSPRKSFYGIHNTLAYGQPSGNIQLFIAGDMKNSQTSKAVEVNGTLFSEKYILDLFTEQSLFYFDGKGSGYQRQNTEGATPIYPTWGEHSSDGIEICRSLSPNNETINIDNDTNTLIMRNNSGNEQGRFVEMDYLKLGRSSLFYLDGEDPMASLFDSQKKFNINLDNYRENGMPLAIRVQQNSSMDLSVNNSSPSKAPLLIYSFNSLLKKGSDLAPLGTSKRTRWDSLDNPADQRTNLEIQVEDLKEICSKTNGADGVFTPEVKITRGYSGGGQLTDNICGVKNYQFELAGNSILNLKLSSNTLSGIGSKSFVLFNGRGNSNKVYTYIPSSSKPLDDGFFNLDYGIGCGNIINNHKFSLFFHTPSLNYSISPGVSCVGTLANTVVVDSKATDSDRRHYSGYKKVVIFDTDNNKKNWTFNCERDGADHVAVHLENTLTNKHMYFYEFARNSTNGVPKNLGVCDGKIPKSLPEGDLSGAVVNVRGVNCSIDDVLDEEGANNCISDNADTGHFNVEFRTTGSPEDYIGVPPESTPPKLLYHFNGNLLDSSDNKIDLASTLTELNNPNPFTFTNGKFGQGVSGFNNPWQIHRTISATELSNIFSGVTLNDPDTYSWSLEFQTKFKSGDINQSVISFLRPDNTTFSIKVTDNKYLEIMRFNNTIMSYSLLDSESLMDDNIFHHIMVVIRNNGNKAQLFIDGQEKMERRVEQNYKESAALSYSGQTTDLFLGMNFAGIIDELRLVSGSPYPVDTTTKKTMNFIPPTEAFSP